MNIRTLKKVNSRDARVAINTEWSSIKRWRRVSKALQSISAKKRVKRVRRPERYI